ncbi:LCP family protein [Pseudoflavonifractor sp. An85]|uniref:LCP family protein n=1 Tax=Pseudoflavonifractor sp. An85 TaxID=1965661 RepID=UPI0013026B46|nr:LCP family protein [Pseudoflavonifractor sp. An85]
MKIPNKNRGSRSLLETVVNFLALVLFLALAVGFVATAISTQFLTPVLIAVLVAVVALLLVVVWALRRNRRPGVRAIGSVLAMVFCLVFAFGIGYIRVGLDTLNKITSTQTQTVAMTVYVREGDNRELNELMSAPWGTLSTDRDNTQAAVAKLEQEQGATLTHQVYPSPSELVDALEQSQVDAILVNQGQLSTLEDMEGYETVLARLRSVETIQVELQTSAQPTTPPATGLDQVITVYISGNDSRSNDINSTERSDVNIIATINPKTRQILLLNTPRDYFVPLSVSGGVKDKLTHAGNFGIEVSMDTLEMLYDTKLDYYFKVNFSGFQQIIDALGGIDVDSQYAFDSFISDYTYEKGINHLDGEKALFYVRERYNLPGGDFQRGVHQMQVIEAVAKKAMSPTILTQYLPLMNALSDCFRTNIPSDLIASLVRDQLDQGGSWDIVTYYVTGSGSKEYTYSVPNWQLDVIVPDQTTVATAKQLMEQIRNDQIITSPQA